MGIAAASMAVLVIGLHLYVGNKIENQNKRNLFLKLEISKVESKIKRIKDIEDEKSRLLARMNIIQQLQTKRPEIVHIFDELVRSLPEGIYLTTATEKKRRLILSGVAQSNARISTLMRKLDQSEWFESPRLEVIQADEKGIARTSRFTLAVQISSIALAQEPQDG